MASGHRRLIAAFASLLEAYKDERHAVFECVSNPQGVIDDLGPMADPDRGKMLKKALRDLDTLVKDARRVKPARGYDYRACNISIEDVEEESGGSAHAYLQIDLMTFRKLAPLLRELIEAELKERRHG